MKTESIVVSLEWAKKLKEVGWDQHEYCSHYWIKPSSAQRPFPVDRMNMRKRDQDTLEIIISAPTVEEILRELPYFAEIKGRRAKLTIEKGPCDPEWDVCYMHLDGHDFRSQYGETLANAAAAMYCYLAENNLLQ